MRAEQAVVLAAGLGLRLESLTNQLPKCLLPIGGRPLIAPTLDALADSGICDVVFVVGFCGDAVRQTIGTSYREMAITYVESPDYASTNNIVSLWRARAAIRPPFLLVESDLIVGNAVIESVMTPDCMAVSRYTAKMRGTGALVDSTGNIKSLELAPERGRAENAGLLKTVNICAISRSLWTSSLLGAISACIENGGTSDFYEAAFADEIASGRAAFRAIDVSSEPWFEVDTAEDLAMAQRLLATAKPAPRGA